MSEPENPEVPVDNLSPADDNPADDTNPFLLAPDHYLLEPLQQKLKEQLEDYISKSEASIRELEKIEKDLDERQEDSGVMLHGFEQELATAEDSIEEYEKQFAEAEEERETVQEEEKEVEERLQAVQQDYAALQKAEEDLQEQTQRIANEVIAEESENNELKSEAIVKKRAVYRAEEQLKELEELKLGQEASIEQNNDLLKHQQDQEEYLSNQLELQKQETEKAVTIQKEAEKEINVINQDIIELQKAWKLSISQIEKLQVSLNSNTAPKLADLESQRVSLEKALVRARTEIAQEIDKVAFTSQEIRNVQYSYNQLIEKAENLQNSQIAELLQELQALKAASDSSNAKLAGIEKAIQISQKEAESVSNETDMQNKLIISKENAILVNNASYAAENRELQALQAELVKIQQEIAQNAQAKAKNENETAKRLLDIVEAGKQIFQLSEALEALQSELQDKDRLITSYEQQLKKNANAIEERSSAITRLNKKLEEYQKAHPESDNGPLQAMLSNIGKELQNASKQMKETQSAWLRAQTDLVMLNEDYQTQQQEISEKEQQRELLERKLSDLEYEKQANNLKITAAEKDIEFLHLDIQKMNSQIASIEQSIEQQNAHNFDSETAVLEAVDSLADQLQQYKARLDEIKATKVDCAAQLVEVEQHVFLQTRRIQIQYKLMQSLIEQSNSQNSNGEISALENEVHCIENEIVGREKQLKALISQLEKGIDIRETMSVSSQTKMKLDMQQKSSSVSGASVQREIETFRQKIAEKQGELDGLRAELQELVAKKQRASASNEELLQMIDEMRADAGLGDAAAAVL